MSKSKVVKKPRSLKSVEGIPRGQRFKDKQRPAPTNAFERGNTAWSHRTSLGRDKLFASPEILWEEACKYFEWCKKNPWQRNEAKTESYGAGIGSSTVIVQIPVERPFTWPGLCLYLDCSESYFRQFKSAERKDGAAFVTVIDRIEKTIYNQKFEGAAVGAFNANIISRDLGLVDKQSTEHSIADDSKKHFPFGE